MTGNNKIIVILGPTSSGKSEVAIRLAKKFDGEIISADSRQIYRGLDIGSGKEPEDKSHAKNYNKNAYWSSGIAHYGIDIVSPRTDFSAGKFKKYADRIIADILKRNKLPIICGGTGFWIKALVDNIAYPEVKPDFKLREELSKKSTEALFKQLQRLDPERAKNIDAKNPVRLIRAIEICKTLGKVPTIIPLRPQTGEGVQREDEGNSKKFVDSDSFVDSHRSHEFLQIGISLAKEKLQENIRLRLKKRFEAGMIKEVKKLHFEDKLSWKRLESFGLGYKLIPQYLRGEIKSEEELFEKVYSSEKDYAKRQMTWFSAQSRSASGGEKDKRIIWLKDYDDIEKETKKFLTK